MAAAAAAPPVALQKGWLEDVASRDGDMLDRFEGDDTFALGGAAAAPGGLFSSDAAATAGGKKKGGGFQTMNLSPELLKAIFQQGYQVPTPIQRKAIPALMDGADVVAMARTGSGKTAAYAIPLIARLGQHSLVVGIRAVILSPTRELSLQIMRQMKLLSRGTQLRCVAIVGGVGIDAQFADLAVNPDIVIASPGRLLHICEETGVALHRVTNVVLDEADRLFELGLQPQIVALLQKVPENSQRALFSATMPSVLAEFAKAGLNNPVVIRLDSEAKLPDRLKQSVFVIRSGEKYAALLFLLKRLVNVAADFVSASPAQAAKLARSGQAAPAAVKGGTKRGEIAGQKRSRSAKTTGAPVKSRGSDIDIPTAETAALFAESRNNAEFPQALVFVESKHHCDFVDMLLRHHNISCRAVHGHMDQEARRLAVNDFAKKRVSVMVTTDVAARGLDLPMLDFVINFSFPFSSKLFVHRVGRVARAGRTGTAFSLLTMEELPYYVEIMQFFDKPLTCERNPSNADFFTADDGCFGRLPEAEVQMNAEAVAKALAEDIELRNQFKVAGHAHEKYSRTRRKPEHDACVIARAYHFDTLPIHPIFDTVARASAVQWHDAITDLKKFKPKVGESWLEMVAGQEIFALTPKETFQSLAKRQREASLARVSDVQPLDQHSHSKPIESAPSKKLTLAESLLLKAQTERTGATKGGDVTDGATPLSGRFFDDSALVNLGAANTASIYRDRKFFLDDKQRQLADNAHYTLRDATLDILPETAQEASNQRRVMAWNKRKNRFIQMNVNDAKAMLKGIKNEAGKMIDFKDKHKFYSKWTSKSSLRVQDCGETEDSALVNQAQSYRRNIKLSPEEEGGAAMAGGGEDGDDDDIVDISNPNQGKKLRMGRKLLRLPKGGKVKTFEDMLSEKRKKQKEKDKLERRRERKAGKKRS